MTRPKAITDLRRNLGRLMSREVDRYAYLEPEPVEDEIDRMESVRDEWEPTVAELLTEGYPHHSEIDLERATPVAGVPWRGRGKR